MSADSRGVQSHLEYWLYGLLPGFRPIAMGELLRLAAHTPHDATLTRFGVPCHLTLKRAALEASRHGD